MSIEIVPVSLEFGEPIYTLEKRAEIINTLRENGIDVTAAYEFGLYALQLEQLTAGAWKMVDRMGSLG